MRHKGNDLFNAPFNWDLDEDFKRAFGEGFGEMMPWRGERFTPAMDVQETEDSYVVEADIPGIKKDEIHIEVADNVLTIKGERKRETDKKEKDYHRIERTYGAFRRSVQIPGGFKHDAVDARFEDGVLRVTLPKPDEAKPKRITVKAS
jgi:HSP20 family protein